VSQGTGGALFQITGESSLIQSNFYSNDAMVCPLYILMFCEDPPYFEYISFVLISCMMAELSFKTTTHLHFKNVSLARIGHSRKVQ